MKSKVLFFGLTVLALTFTACTESSLDDNQDTEQGLHKIDKDEIGEDDA